MGHFLLPVALALVFLVGEGSSEERGAFERILSVNSGDGSQTSLGRGGALFEGDVRLTEEQRLNHVLFGDPDGPQSRAANNVDKIKWPNAVIPYEFDCSVASIDRAVRTTMEAIQEWESKTCIRFVKRTTEKEFLWFHRGMGCWCEVGKVRGRKTWLSIGNGCEYKHVMVHEIGHAIGFWHEQSRPDRDYYLKINWQNISPGLEHNFEKKKWATEVVDYGVPYDYSSIMHYPWTAFSKDGTSQTLVPIRPLNGKTPYVKLSDSDALQANRMYKCAGSRANTIPRNGQSCADVADTVKCEDWKKAGFCDQHKAMIYHCKKTCNFCSSDLCMDKEYTCRVQAAQGRCSSQYMRKNCPHSCRYCDGSATPPPTDPPTLPPTLKPMQNGTGVGLVCVDKRDECPRWAASGDCLKNGWTESTCRISCRTRCDTHPVKPKGACSEAFGLGWPGKYSLPDSAFSASTEYKPGGWRATADNARLYFEDDQTNMRIGAWCATDRDNQWLQIDLGRVKSVRAIATQGRDVFHEHVKEYRLAFSTDGSNFDVYKENGQEKVFTGNCDHFTPVINTFNRTRARYVKILVGKSAYPCMRVELYGCDA